MTKKEQEILIEENLWLVPFVAKQYRERGDWSEMISAGRYGLLRGVVKYDPSKSKPSTYLIHWVRAEILKSLYEDRNVHIPFNRINKYISDKSVTFNDGLYPRYEISLDSFSSWVGHEEDDANSDNIEFQSSLSSEFINTIEDNEQSEHVLFILENSKLTEQEREVIIHRFGLYGEEKKTLRQVGNIIGYSAMGVQKLEKKGIEKLSKNKLLPFAR